MCDFSYQEEWPNGWNVNEQVAGRARRNEERNFKYLNTDGLPPSYASNLLYLKLLGTKECSSLLYGGLIK